MRIFRKLEDWFAAVAFAEAGEFETAIELAAGQKRIVLALTGSAGDRKAFEHALSMATRTAAGLEMLVTADDSATRELLAEAIAELRRCAVGYRLVRRKGCVRKLLLERTKKGGNIISVVIESSAALDADCREQEKQLKGFTRALGCPLTLVS